MNDREQDKFIEKHSTDFNSHADSGASGKSNILPMLVTKKDTEPIGHISHQNHIEEIEVEEDLVCQMPTNLNASLEEIVTAHKENRLEDNQYKTAQEFMDNVKFSVPLNKLYKVIASCNYNASNAFCPVLVEIVDKFVLKNNKGMKFLLQVWTNKGDLVFEKALKQPCCNWNLTKDKFLFQLNPNSPQIYLVRLSEKKQAQLFEFVIPEDVVQNKTNTGYYEDRFVVPPERDHEQFIAGQRGEEPISESNHEISDSEDDHKPSLIYQQMQTEQDRISNHSQARLTSSQNQIAEEPRSDKSVSQLFSDQIIVRAPDKMIDYLDGHILLAYRNSIVYLNVSKYGIDDDANVTIDSFMTADSAKTADNANFATYAIQRQDLFFLDLLRKYKIICLQEIGNGMTAVVLEDLQTRQIRFLRAHYSDSKMENKKQLKLLQLGILVSLSKKMPSKLIKYRSVVKFDTQKQKHYQVAIVLRESGRIEVYSDFILVSEYENKNLQCVDIETDFNEFFLKFVVNSDKVTNITQFKKLKYQLRQVRHIWRNRISFSTSRLMNSLVSWKYVIHSRIANYFRMYSQVVNFSMFLLVSHRNMISVYDKTTGSETNDWTDTISFPDGHVRQIFIKRRSKEEQLLLLQQKVSYFEPSPTRTNKKEVLNNFNKYHIVTLVGIHSIYFNDINQRGHIDRLGKRLTAPGRILKYHCDEQYKCGTLMLTDNSKTQEMQKDYDNLPGECSLYKFPFVKDEKAILTLFALKSQTFYPLLNSQESACVSHDCAFDVLQANRAVFEKQFDETESNDDKVLTAFADKDYVTVVALSSPSNNCFKMFPILKEKFEDTDLMHQMRLIKEGGNIKEIEQTTEDSKRDGKHIHSFYITSNEISNCVDEFASVYENTLKIYSKDKDDGQMDVRLSYQGLNIRGCVDVHQGYLYTISDSINQPPQQLKTGEDGEQHLVTINENWNPTKSGFHVYDMARLFEGKIEKYKLAPAVGGQSNQINISKFNDRFAFIQNFDQLVIIPFAHLNMMNCIGMGQKHEYLIWREKNGFFTALDRRNNLQTWSLTSGKLLYNERQFKDAVGNQVKDYRVYKSDKDDVTYTRNFYNFEDHSISLLVSKEIVDINLAQSQQKLSREIIEGRLQKSNAKNTKGKLTIDKDIQGLEANLFEAVNNQSNVEVIVKNSQTESQPHHFKVMQMRVHEDTKDKSDCKLRFHFFFSLIQKKERKELQDCDWDINSQPIQRLYLSHNTQYLMEVVNNFVATVYYRVNVEQDGTQTNLDMFGQQMNYQHVQEQDDGQLVKWKVDYRIRRFPTSLAEHTSVPYLFSPNFKYQLDFQYRAKQFIIKESATQHVYMYIPNDLISFVWNQTEGQDAVKLILSRIKWHDERTLRIINASNIDCLFELSSTDPKDLHEKDRFLKLISHVKVDNQHENMVSLNSPHFFSDRVELEPRDVLERLIRMNQEYKTATVHAFNQGRKDFNLLEKINKIDYNQRWETQSSGFDIEMSFTWLDWRISDLVTKEQNFELEHIDTEQQIQICFNILPQGRGILHLLAESKESDSVHNQSDQIQAVYAMQDLFEVTSKEHQLWITGADDGTSFEVPILPNMYGENPLEICLGISQTNKRNLFENIFKSKPVNKGKVGDSKNLALANLILDGIKDYGFMHSSLILTQALIQAIRINLPTVGDYMESRLKKVEHQFQMHTQRAIKSEQLRKCPSMGDYAALRAPIWASEKNIKDQLFETDGQLQPMKFEFLDIPFVYTGTPAGYEFMKALKKCDGLDIFALKSVQIIIDNHHQHWQKVNLYLIGIPMAIQLFAFWFWSNFAVYYGMNRKHQTPDDWDFDLLRTICEWVLVITAIYLLMIEVTVLKKLGMNYFASMTRLFNIITPSFLILNLVYQENTPSFWRIQTWVALAIWFRFFLFLKRVDEYAWIVRMITICIREMVVFLLIFFIGIVAFADAFRAINKILEINWRIEPRFPIDQDIFFEKYFRESTDVVKSTILIAIGVFDDSNQEVMGKGEWLVFLLCCIFNLVLLLNLLVAVINEIYERVSETKIETTYKEKAYQMALMQDSLFGFYQAQQDNTEMLFIAQVVSSTELKKKTAEDKLDLFMAKVDKFSKELDEKSGQRLQDFVDDLNDKVDELKQNHKDTEQGNNLVRQTPQSTRTIIKSPKRTTLKNKLSRAMVNELDIQTNTTQKRDLTIAKKASVGSYNASQHKAVQAKNRIKIQVATARSSVLNNKDLSR